MSLDLIWMDGAEIRLNFLKKTGLFHISLQASALLFRRTTTRIVSKLRRLSRLVLAQRSLKVSVWTPSGGSSWRLTCRCWGSLSFFSGASEPSCEAFITSPASGHMLPSVHHVLLYPHESTSLNFPLQRHSVLQWCILGQRMKEVECLLLPWKTFWWTLNPPQTDGRLEGLRSSEKPAGILCND